MKRQLRGHHCVKANGYYCETEKRKVSIDHKFLNLSLSIYISVGEDSDEEVETHECCQVEDDPAHINHVPVGFGFYFNNSQPND